jgi:hypothetical protein
MAICKSALSAPSPKCYRLFAVFTMQLCRDGKKRTEQYGPIIVSQFHKPRLLHETAKCQRRYKMGPIIGLK